MNWIEQMNRCVGPASWDAGKPKETTMEYSEMNLQQRAEYLLAKGVEAKLDIDPEALAPGYAAHAIGVGKLPCGYHGSEQAAIDAGTAWLRAKAMPHNA